MITPDHSVQSGERVSAAIRALAIRDLRHLRVKCRASQEACRSATQAPGITSRSRCARDLFAGRAARRIRRQPGERRHPGLASCPTPPLPRSGRETTQERRAWTARSRATWQCWMECCHNTHALLAHTLRLPVDAALHDAAAPLCAETSLVSIPRSSSTRRCRRRDAPRPGWSGP